MFIIDAQQNIAFNAQQLGRDFTRWAWHQREEDAGRDLPPATVSLRDNLLGRIAIVFGCVAVVSESSPALRNWQRYSYRTSEDAAQLARWQTDHYQRLADDNDAIRLLLTQSDLAAVLESWRPEKEIGERKLGIVIALKGAEPISEPLQFEDWYEYGARVVAPAWGSTRYAAAGGDITRLGYELLEVLAGFNVILDVAGLSQRAAADAIDRYEGSLIASHAGPSQFHDGPRALSDDLIRRLAERDGVIGVMVYNPYLRKEWQPGDPKRAVTVSHWADAVDSLCQLTGTVAHVGLGSDIDGGYAYGSLPAELDTSSDLWLLRRALLDRGFSAEDATAILGGNMLKKLKEVLPEG